jgi:hypothetical protein
VAPIPLPIIPLPPGFFAYFEWFAVESVSHDLAFVFSVLPVVKKARFLVLRQEYILDKRAPDTIFCQCLQGFRVLKKGVIMACTNSAFYAIMPP